MSIQPRLRLSSHTRTNYIELDTKKCHACWECLEVCPEHVFGKVSVFRHRHTRINNADACKGCKKCVQTCSNGAIRYTYISPKRASKVKDALAR